jgi:hypothetical protein
VVTIGIDAQLKLVSIGSLEDIGVRTEQDGHTLQFLRTQMGIPQSFPIFREASIRLVESGTLSVAFNLRLAKDESLIRCYVQTPGFAGRADWTLKRSGLAIKLIPPT